MKLNINNDFMYKIAPNVKLGKVFYSTKCILDGEVKTYLNGTPLRYYKLTKNNRNNKNNRNFSY